MTLDQMKTLLAGRLGQRTDIDEMIYSEIRQAQDTLERTPPYPWFLLDFLVAEYSLSINPLPFEFISFYQDFIFIRKKTDETNFWVPPGKIYGAELEYGADTRSGRPRNFVLYGKWVILYPQPDVSYTLHIDYYAKQLPLASGASENEWSLRAGDLLVAEAGWHVARNIRDNEAATLFGQDRAEARRRIAQETTERLESMRRAVIAAGEDALLGQTTREDAWQ